MTFGVGNGVASFESITSNQSINGTGTLTIKRLKVNKVYSDSSKLTFTRPATISVSLEFAAGKIVNTGQLITLNDNATVTGAGLNSYIEGGPVKKIGNEVFTFPLGSTGVYMPLTITAPSVDTDAFQVDASATVPQYSSNMDTILKSISPMYWNVSRTAGTSGVQITLYWNENTPKAIFPDNAYVAQLISTTWQAKGQNNLTYIGLDGNVTSTLVSSFGSFTLGYSFANPSLCTTSDATLNWISGRVFDEYGKVISESRAYYDKFGKTTQSQTRNLEKNNIIASATIYDTYGRAAIQTLPAPIDQQCFSYRDLLRANPTQYAYPTYISVFFDNPNTTGNSLGEINNPYPVSSLEGEVGKYYSNNNTVEPYVPASSFPYTRTDFNDKVSGGVVRVALAGESLKMGNTGKHERKAITLPLLSELDAHYLALKTNHFVAGNLGSMCYSGIKEITVDENGVENIVFKDTEGKVLATCMEGGTAATDVAGSINPVLSYYELSAPTGNNISNIRIISYEDIEIFNSSGTSLYSGIAKNNTVLTLSAGGYIQIRSKSPFVLNYVQTNISTSVATNKRYYSNNDDGKGRGFLDIYVKSFSSVDLSNYSSSLSIKVTDLLSGDVLYNGLASSFSNSSLNSSSGFIRFQVDNVPFSVGYTGSVLNINYDFYYTNFAYNYYDHAGRLVAQVAPKGVDISSTSYPKFTNKNTYNSLSQVITAETTDAGKTELVYRKDGALRFSQNEQQRVTGKFNYFNYDNTGRQVETGEYDPALGTYVFESYANYTGGGSSVHTLLESTATGGGLDAESCLCRYWKRNTVYDEKDGSIPGSRTQRFVYGMVSKTFYKDPSHNTLNTTWYSYDEQGRVEWTVQEIQGISGAKTIDYYYAKGNVKKLSYQKDQTDQVEYSYEYDLNNKLKRVKSRVGSGSFQEEAQYHYYLHGPLKRVEIADDLQGIDYVYTINGWLKSINHPELLTSKDPGADGTGSLFAKDVFGMALDYYNNDYTRTALSYGSENNMSGYAEQFNGEIRAMTWQTQGQGISGSPCQYSFSYDKKYQLTDADFGSRNMTTNSFVVDANNRYRMHAEYDVNGNFTYKATDRGAGNTADDYFYRYGKILTPEYTNPTTNKLYVVPTLLGVRYYDYDKIGQLTSEKAEDNKEKRLTYDVYGNVTEVKDENNYLKVKYVYNERGERIKKITYGTAGAVSYNTYYVRDHAGAVMSIYTDQGGSLQQREIPMQGIGTIYKNGSTVTYTYDLTDHLGNVRVTILQNKDMNGDAVVETWQDYLPFGEINPVRKSAVSSIVSGRHDYQGEFAEKDAETGWSAFELRMYDARLGRWLSADPANEFFSPYIGMGNNPITYGDPNGATIWDWLPAKFYQIKTALFYTNVTTDIREFNGVYYVSTHWSEPCGHSSCNCLNKEVANISVRKFGYEDYVNNSMLPNNFWATHAGQDINNIKYVFTPKTGYVLDSKYSFPGYSGSFAEKHLRNSTVAASSVNVDNLFGFSFNRFNIMKKSGPVLAETIKMMQNIATGNDLVDRATDPLSGYPPTDWIERGDTSINIHTGQKWIIKSESNYRYVGIDPRFSKDIK